MITINLLCMKTKAWHPVQVLALLVGILLRCAVAFAADTPENQKRIEKCVTNWQAQFGPVDFNSKERWNWMISVHPQPVSSFKAFDDEILSPGITGDHHTWVRRFFKGTFLNALTNLGPSKYYVNQGRTESSLLYCELEFEGNTISIQESYEAFLMTVKPRAFDASKGIDRATVGRMLFDWVRLNKRQPPIRATFGVPGSANFFSQEMDEENPFTIPYASQAELADSFKLPPQLKVGDTFSNWTNAPENITLYLNYWQAYVVGFVGTNGVSLMLFKAEYAGPRIGRIYDFNWLNKGLFRGDGKTLVDPPKNEHSNDPYNSGNAVR